MELFKSKLIISYGNFLSKQIADDEQRIIIDLLEKDEKAKLLDLGCLYGNRTYEFMEKISPAKTFGLDILSFALKKAKRDFGIIGKKGDLNKRFPFLDQSVDVVTSTHSIEHITNTDMFLSEIYRVLKPHGYCLIATDNLASWFNIFSLVLGRQPTAGPTISTRYLVTLSPLWWEGGSGGVRDIKFPMHHNVMTMKTLEILLEKYGFKVEKVLGSGYPPFPYPLASLFTKLDLYHSMFSVIKARKK
ncbi:hypothetical protein A3D00_00130 [Candidatus Woesebacteria bacterium RIFCSPHIGHO2_02_FULL_38_9]|nr:MAG: hypothetical protein A3D00_00130 [Candidatus Woesebacteria bacterium RIFCSPHIGHO2_02_FULL_38_9]OGM57849.1 MAG: hypothetical protein A3A50_02440 [Candidatus Woesebacteria bacterium RIFCSPLOWO2_01_FULL_38_20]